jgi:hypothetical protein
MNEDERRRRGIRRTVVMLVLLVLGIYLAFLLGRL